MAAGVEDRVVVEGNHKGVVRRLERRVGSLRSWAGDLEDFGGVIVRRRMMGCVVRGTVVVEDSANRTTGECAGLESYIEIGRILWVDTKLEEPRRSSRQTAYSTESSHSCFPNFQISFAALLCVHQI